MSASKELREYIESKRSQDKQGRRLLYEGDSVAQLDRTLTEQLDYAHLIMRQIENAQFASMYSYDAFASAVSLLVYMIPDEDHDDQFKEDIQKAHRRQYVHTGQWQEVAFVRKEKIKIVENYDWHSVFKACINLFRRRGLLWGETQQEVL